MFCFAFLYSESARGGGHQLHQALLPLRGNGVWIVVALHLDHRIHQRRADIEILRGLFHQGADSGVWRGRRRGQFLNIHGLVRNNFTGYWFRSNDDTSYQAASARIGMHDGNQPWNYDCHFMRFFGQVFGTQTERGHAYHNHRP